MKIIKFLLKLVLWLIALVILALLTLPLWFGPVAKAVAGKVAPKVAQIECSMNYLSLNPYTARFELRGLQVGNPAGYSEKYAATVGEIAFDAETASLVTDVIHIEEIRVKDIFVSYVSGGPNNVNNFLQIQYNVAGGKEKYEAAQAEKQRQQAAETEVQKTQPAPEQPTKPAQAADQPERRFIIDRLEISGLSIQLGFLPIRLPVGLTLTDIGKESGGATLAEVSQQVWAEILKAAGVVGDQLKTLGSGTVDATAKTLGAAADAATNVVNNAKAVGEGVKAVGKEVKAVGESVKKAFDSLRGAGKKK